MRKVKYKRWIPKTYRNEDDTVSENPKSYKAVAETNTGCFESDFLSEGLFHQWAGAYEEFDNGAGNYTVALVEIFDGTIVEVLPKNLKFISEIQPRKWSSLKTGDKIIFTTIPDNTKNITLGKEYEVKDTGGNYYRNGKYYKYYMFIDDKGNHVSVDEDDPKYQAHII